VNDTKENDPRVLLKSSENSRIFLKPHRSDFCKHHEREVVRQGEVLASKGTSVSKLVEQTARLDG
jgi:hypothetical protein